MDPKWEIGQKILDQKFTIQPTAKVKVGPTNHESPGSSNPMRTVRLWIYKDTCRSAVKIQRNPPGSDMNHEIASLKLTTRTLKWIGIASFWDFAYFQRLCLLIGSVPGWLMTRDP